MTEFILTPDKQKFLLNIRAWRWVDSEMDEFGCWVMGSHIRVGAETGLKMGRFGKFGRISK